MGDYDKMQYETWWRWLNRKFCYKYKGNLVMQNKVDVISRLQ